MDLVRILFKEALLALKPKGVIALELFEGHLEQAADLCQKAGFTDVRIVKDLTDRPRVLLVMRPNNQTNGIIEAIPEEKELVWLFRLQR